MRRTHRFCASVAVFFKVPEQGMKQYEILSRGTTFAVRSCQGLLRFLAPGHVIAPWLFPKLYRVEWLSAVSETHVKRYLELRDLHKAGDVVTTYPLVGAKHHPARDLAALHLAREAEAKADTDRRDVTIHPVTLRDTALQKGQPVQLVGYEVEDTDDGQGEGRMSPFSTTGSLNSRTQHQAFLQTAHRLNFGMCGSPVLDEELQCCGFVEGVVPAKPPGEQVSDYHRLVEGNACFIEAEDLAHFLGQLEHDSI